MSLNINEIQSIEGWLTDKEAEELYSIAKKTYSNNVIVEIGSWKGKSAVALAKGSLDGQKSTIYSIDPHVGSKEHHQRYGKVNTYEDFLNNLKQFKVSEVVKSIKKFSYDAINDVHEPISVLFIDGAHDYENVKRDFDDWSSKVVSKGLIGFHDSWHALGVQFLTSKILLTCTHYKNPKLIDTLTIIEKVDSISFPDRINNVVFVIYRLFFGWIGTLKMDFKGDTVGRFRKLIPSR